MGGNVSIHHRVCHLGVKYRARLMHILSSDFTPFIFRLRIAICLIY